MRGGMASASRRAEVGGDAMSRRVRMTERLSRIQCFRHDDSLRPDIAVSVALDLARSHETVFRPERYYLCVGLDDADPNSLPVRTPAPK